MKHQALRIILSITIIGFIANSCSHEEPLKVESNDLIPIELSTRGGDFVDHGNSFAFKLLQKVEQEEKSNFTLSPLSLSLAFGMLIEGAEDGPILDSVCKVLGYEEGGRQDIKEFCSTMMKRLPEMDKMSTVSMSNLVVTNNDIASPDKAFQTAVSNYHNSYLKSLPFLNKQRVCDYINNWGYENSNKMIKETIKESDFNSLTTAILVNSLYFKGQWANYFKKSKTENESFTTEQGDVKKVKMMKQEGIFEMGSFENTSILRMPYGNGAYVFDVFLPWDDALGVKDVIKSIMSLGGEYSHSLYKRKVDVWLPKFEGSLRIDLEKILKEMGMETAFEEAWLKILDVNDKPESSISKCFQMSSIKVDETGTEAAAESVITAALGASSSSFNEPQTYVFHADRPFVYTISETSTGAVLFSGVYRGE